MIKQLKGFRLVLAAAIATAVLVLSMVVVSPEVEAAATDCGDGDIGSLELTNQWLVTGDALERTLNGDCPSNAQCKEQCSIQCGDVIPSGAFQCFPI